jgi:hypothetical protein
VTNVNDTRKKFVLWGSVTKVVTISESAVYSKHLLRG